MTPRPEEAIDIGSRRSQHSLDADAWRAVLSDTEPWPGDLETSTMAVFGFRFLPVFTGFTPVIICHIYSYLS